jgi:hypothetical protein
MTTGRTPALAPAFAGRWRIVEMDQWEDLDLLEPAHITFFGKDGGELAFVLCKPISTCATDRATVRLARSSRGKGPTIIAMRAGAVGPRSAPPAAWSVTSSSTKATTQASTPNASDFFNSLLDGF